MTNETAKRQLSDDGFAVVPAVLTPDQTRDVRKRLLAAAAKSEAAGVPTHGYPFDVDKLNRRIFHLFNLDPIFVDLIQHPAALDFVNAVLGDAFLISNFSANITVPGNGPMLLHADQGYVPAPWPEEALAVNVAWLLDDFTDENGGTRYVPGSHRLGHGPSEHERYESVPIEAEAGSILVMDGRLWHQTGANRTSDYERAALFGYYVARWIRGQVNWNAVLWPEIIETLTPVFLDRLGFYTGNVEVQIPAGSRASIVTPAEIEAVGGAPFPLAAGKHR